MTTEAKLIDGKAYAAGLRERVAGAVTQLKAEHDLQPGLAVVLVGEDPASQVYVRNKHKQTLEAGMNVIAAAEHFAKASYRRFPVMREGRIVGQISRHDILGALTDLWG